MTLKLLENALFELDLEEKSALVAVSGGVDSSVLLHALHQLAPVLQLQLSVGHINHGLRGEASDADEEAVRRAAQQFDLPCFVRTACPKPLREGVSSLERPTLQEAAREVRYQALFAIAEEAGADVVVTAHTADDQAETVLLRLLRGTGPDGLAGIPPRSADGRLVRPMLGISRAQILDYAEKSRIVWREDASNESEAYTRNRLRKHWIPSLREEFNPQLVAVLTNLAEAQRRDTEWIESRVDAEAERWIRREGEEIMLERRGWDGFPEALARRLARRALVEAGGSRHVSRVHLQRMVAFLRGGRTGAQIEFPGGIILICRREAFCLRSGGSQSDTAC